MPPRKTAAAATAEAPKVAELKRIGRSMALVPVVGTAPLVVHKFSTKAQAQMLDKQMGKVTQRQPKDPDQVYKEAMHLLPDGRHGFPAVGFKAAIIGAARLYPGSKLTMESLKSVIAVKGEAGQDTLSRVDLVPIMGEWTGDIDTLVPAEPTMRQDYARNETGVADIRFRPQYEPWSAVIPVVYVKNILTLDSVVALVDAAGIGGVGEWRPASKKSHTGQLGTWQVPDDAQVREIEL